MMGKLRNDARGFTMLEIIVALAVLAIGIIGVLHAFSSSMRTCQTAETYSVAAGLALQAESELERTSGLEAGTLSGTFAGADSKYRWTADLQPMNQANLFLAKINVLWDEGSRARNYQVYTVLKAVSEEEQPTGTPTSGTGK
jgi:general secretion pathway protein I